MEIVKKFQSNNFEIEICVKGTNENPLFRANDIATILELTNIHKNIKDFDNTEKVVCIIDTNGGKQKVAFLTVKGLKKVICKSRKSNAIVLAQQLGIDVYDIFHIPLETCVISFLQEVYETEDLIQQYKVDPYRIDLYFPKYNLAIECDEYFHIFKKKEDEIREKYIKEKLNCTFLRIKQVKGNQQLKNLSELIKKINFVIYKVR